MRDLVSYLLNYPRTAYLCMEFGHKTMPYHLAVLLKKANGKNISSLLALPTCDGSGQACHPSYACFRGKEFLAYTPYPYGMEWYENPCLAAREQGQEKFQPVKSAFPIIKPQARGQEHYSDPCCIASGQELFLVFRKCVRLDNGKVDHLYQASSIDGITWSKPVQIAESAGDTLISPAIVGKSLFCVECNQDDTKIVRYQIDLCGKAPIRDRTLCSVVGVDPQWQVWHIDVRQSANGQYEGLFMLRDRETATCSRLALFSYADDEWSLVRELSLSPEESQYIRFLYKSCFFTDGKLLCSALDKWERWVIFEKEISNG